MSSTEQPNASRLDFTQYWNIIDGQQTTTAETRNGINPATEVPNPDVPLSTEQDVDQAVTASLNAFKAWSKTGCDERKKALLALADALEGEREGFVKLLVQEQGKPTKFAHVEFDFSLSCLRETAALNLPTDELIKDNQRIVTRYTPLGLAIGIVPWNYPLLLACAKIAPCVVTGNTIIVKPSPFTPYAGLKLVELAQRIFPPGVVQALSGDDRLGPWLTAHPGPSKISFTGSSATGKKVMESASRTLKRVTLELGGNDAALIREDVDVEKVAPEVAKVCFLNAGQLCLAIKRIYVNEKIYEKFRDALVVATKELMHGPGTQDGVYLGPVQNAMQYERVKTFFDDIQKSGQTAAIGGVVPDGPGYFFPPTIVDRPDADARIIHEEPFGPIVPLIPYSTDEEAIALANATNQGLGASVWSSDIATANALAAQLEAGTVWVNRHYSLDARVPYGGHKESGLGVEFGTAGLIAYCNSQALHLEIP